MKYTFPTKTLTFFMFFFALQHEAIGAAAVFQNPVIHNKTLSMDDLRDARIKAAPYCSTPVTEFPMWKSVSLGMTLFCERGKEIVVTWEGKIFILENNFWSGNSLTPIGVVKSISSR